MIDCDTHLYEPRGMWVEYTDPADRSLALALEEDRLGHTWLTHQGRRIHLAEVHHPGDVEAMGEYRRKVRAGAPAAAAYDDQLPRDFWDPAARRDGLRRLGVDEAVVFPNFGLLWERALSADLPATLANMAAWNRWASVIATEGRGQLHPVGHLTLRDGAWLQAQLAALAGAGVRLAMVAPGLVDGLPLSHPELDRVWSAFEEHAVSPVFHVSAFPHPFHEAWYAADPDAVNPVLSSVFLHEAAAVCLADLAVHGTFARHPDLRVGVMELSAVWLPLFLLMLDGGYFFHARFNGEPLTRMDRRPAEYVTAQVRVAAFSYELPTQLADRAGDLFMACSDYPHAEGTDHPLADYRGTCGERGEPARSPALFGGNVGWLLRR